MAAELLSLAIFYLLNTGNCRAPLYCPPILLPDQSKAILISDNMSAVPLMRSSTVVEPGSGRSPGSRNPCMNHSPYSASSGSCTDSSKDSYTGSSRVSDTTCSLGNSIVDTGKYRDSCGIGMDKGMSMNTVMNMSIHNSVRNPDHSFVHNSDHSSARNLDQQPMKCKAPRGQEVPYLV